MMNIVFVPLSKGEVFRRSRGRELKNFSLAPLVCLDRPSYVNTVLNFWLTHCIILHFF